MTDLYLNLEPTTESPVVVLIAGVPGAGKSTLAEGLARRLRVPVFSMDWVMGSLVLARAVTDENAVEVVGLQLTAAVARHVQLGIDVIVDATGHTREERGRWRELTERLGGVFVGVECVCSDAGVHRERVEGRDRGIPGWHATVPWQHVERMRGLWEPWDEDHLVIDSAGESAEGAVLRVVEVVRGLRSTGETADPGLVGR
ncbi:ATP-binding protein [Lentzea sp. NPDC051208]|uniref:AAA family ATPase n=1 Tax=Lentzea sp. NPDC051208 TaxID=3154642 RepID=UPI003442B8B1